MTLTSSSAGRVDIFFCSNHQNLVIMYNRRTVVRHCILETAVELLLVDSCIRCENWPQTCRSPAAGVLKDCQVAMNAVTEDVACYAMLREVHSGGSEQLGGVSNKFISYYP